jgi:hypothetical protein
VEEKERRSRIEQRWTESPGTTFAMTRADHASNLAVFVARTTMS